jgi:hypothetical protein
MTAKEFDDKIKQMRAEVAAQNIAPLSLEEMLLERLRADMHAHEGTILEVVYAWRNYESASDWREAEIPYPQTRRLIDLLLPYTEQRPMLRATLSSINGEIFHESGQIDSAVDAYVNAVDDLHEMHLDVDGKRIYSMMTLGHLLLLQGNMPGAETLFLDVLSYPWYLVNEAELQSLLREYYLKAGQGLIQCRRGDLAALKEIFFVPATQAELLPLLRRAIEEAGGRFEK